jgi:hypothetical protein
MAYQLDKQQQQQDENDKDVAISNVHDIHQLVNK